MAATMGIFEVISTYTTGVTGLNVAGGNVYFRATNTASNTGSPTPATADPVTKPGTGTTQSVERYLHARVTAAGGHLGISNLQFYATVDAVNGLATGVSFYMRTASANTWGSPVAPSSLTGADLLVSGTTVSNWTAGTPKNIHQTNTAALASGATGDLGDFVVLFASIGTSAAAGSMLKAGGSCNFVFQWDEL